MATVQAIKELLIRARSEGVDKVAADLNKVAAAQKQVGDAAAIAAKVTEDATRSQVSAANAFNRTAASIDPAFRAFQQMSRAQSVFDRALAQGVINNDQYAASLQRLQARYAPLAAANNNLVGQTGNLAAQFNDIAVQLAGGQSPFLIAMQQGTQIAQVLGETGGGARGAVKALGAAFMSVLSPVNLLTIGAITLGGTLVQYLSGAGKETEKLDDRLKAHADLIRGIRDAYGEAAKGLEEYANQSNQVFEAQIRANMEKLKGDIQRLWFDMAATFQRPIGPAFTDPATGAGFGGADTGPDPKYAAFQQAIDQLQASAADGIPDIRAFREEVARVIREAGDNQKIRDLGNELLKNSESAAKVEAALLQAERAIRLTKNAAGEGVGDIKEFNRALEDLSRIALPNLTPQQQALEKYREAIGKAGGREDRAAAQAAYEAAIRRAGERDAEKAAEEARREAEANAKRQEQTWARAIDRIQDQTRALEQQAHTFGMGAGEVARYRAEQELLNAAWEAGKADTPQLRAQIASMADQAGQAAERMEQLRQASEWSDFTTGTLKGFVSDLRNGKSAADDFANALERIADKLLDMTLNWMFGNGPNPFASLMQAFGGASGSGSNVMAMPGAGGGGVAAFSGLGKLPEVITSAVAPITQAATQAATQVATAASRSTVVDFIRQEASLRGIDPNIAVRVARSEGLNVFDPSRGLNGAGDVRNGVATSFGPYQLHYGGLAPGHAYNVKGLGDVFTARTGLDARDPSTWQEQIRFSLDQAKQGGWGPWYGARKVGIDRWDGIDRNGPQAFNGSAGDDNLLGGAGSDLTQNFQQLSNTTSQLSPNLQQFGTDFQSMSSSLSNSAPQFTENLSRLGATTGQGGEVVGSALKDTAGVIGQGANGIGQAINQLGQALSSGGGGGGGFGNILGGLFGGGGWGNTASWTIPSYMDGISFGFHSGGLVGRDHSFKRYIHPSYFDDAPRHHSGLRPDEVPAILQKGEWVLSKDDVAGIRSANSNRTSAGHQAPILNVNVMNNHSGAEVRTEQRPDGSVDVVVEQAEALMAERAKRGRGALAKTMPQNTNRLIG